jgi:hypothetical protein
MAQKKVSVWYDPEGDFLEVIWEPKTGYFRETEDDRVMEKVVKKAMSWGLTFWESVPSKESLLKWHCHN